MNFRRVLIAALLLTLSYLPAFCQRDSVALNTIISKSVKLLNEHPIEKVYLHFDKPFYAIGDTIWFKAYVTIDHHQPTMLSKVVYVDLINNADSIVKSLKLPLINGAARGDITLAQLFNRAGSYHIRAYTNWMRNYDPAYFFNKVINVGDMMDFHVNTRVTYNNQLKNKDAKISATVFYTDQDGNVLSNKKVSWHAENDDETVSKGRGTTDQKGMLTITFSTNKISDTNPGSLISVIDLENKKTFTNKFAIKLEQAETDVQFFPEGGELLTGIRTKVAIKAVKPNGLGLDFKGTITDNNNIEVATLASQHVGMGIFAILPEDGKTYKANLIFKDGTQKTYDLPKTKIEGINLSVNNADLENLNIKIASNAQFYQKNVGKTFYVLAQNGGAVLYAAQTVLRSQVYTASIPKSKFPTGIIQLTLFSSLGEPLSERIAFVRRNDLLNLTLNTDKKTYSRRQKVRLNINAKNGKLPVAGNFSIAVIDESKVTIDENAETTILSHLLLTSDLKGYIEKPNYYFNHPDEKTDADLDVLMLTQGYRRFSYKDIMANKLPQDTFLPEQGIEVTGTLRTSSGMPVNKGNIKLQIPDRNFSTQTITDPSGVFKFSKLILNDSSKVVLNARDNYNANNLMIMVDGTKPMKLTQNYDQPSEIANIDSTLRPYLQNSKKEHSGTHELHEVVIKSTRDVKKPNHEDYPMLRGLSMEPDHLISGDKFKDCPFFTSCLQVFAMGLTYDNNNLYVTRDYNAGNRTTPVQVYLKGMPVDYNELSNVNSNDIESVEVFFNDGLSGVNRSTGTKGVLVVNLKKEDKRAKFTAQQIQDLIHQNSVVTYMPRGYTITRDFYSPKYDVQTSQGVDARSTIYWNAEVKTDKAGNSIVEFYNADGTGTYRAVIEGMDNEGNLGRYVYKYTVQ